MIFAKVGIWLLLLCGFIITAKAGEPKTENLKVSGNCGMCKKTIEKTAKEVAGVEEADWNKRTKMLEITYDPEKTTLETVGKKIAEAGYDNDKAKADDKKYGELKECCRYERDGNKKGE